MGIFNFREQIGFYAGYHHNVVNQRIHMVFVPLILFTSLVFVTQVKPATVPEVFNFLPPTLPLNLALVVGVFYNLYYIVLNPAAGLMYVPFMSMLLFGANYFAANVPSAQFVALALHISSWIMQFYGHGVHEGRKPSLFDNLVQSLVMAPFFVFLETLFALGYNPKLAKEIDAQAAKDVAAFRASKNK